VVLVVSHLLSNIAPVSKPLPNAQMEFFDALGPHFVSHGYFQAMIHIFQDEI